MMTNHPTSEDLFAYRDGELELEKRGLVEAHVLSCTACQTRLDDMSDSEAMLRQGLEDPSDAYFDRMTESVMGRVTGNAPAGAGAGAGATPKRASGADPRRERVARPRSFDDGPRNRAPGLPWPAILSAASAAAAVVVVVVMLVQRPDAWRHAPASGVVGLPGRDNQDRAETPEVAQDTPAPTLANDSSAPAAPEELAKQKESADALRPETKNDLGEKKAQSIGGVAVPSLIASDLKDAAKAVRQEDEVKTESGLEAVPEATLQRSAAKMTPSQGGDQRFRVSGDAAAAPPSAGAGFAEVAGRYGLPLLYDPSRVSGSTLMRAEPDLRVLYQTGRAGEDSARVRLYLAEAARERAAGSFDAETFDTIVHHYRRAVELARDGATARLARKRLEEFVLRHSPGQ